MRYYTYCLFSPSKEDFKGRTARYPNAPTGFIFHDDEKDLSVEDIRLPLFRLRHLLITEGASEETVSPNRAIVVNIDKHTLAATFSMSGFPEPHRWHAHFPNQEVKVYPLPIDEDPDHTSDHLTGWLISHVGIRDTHVDFISYGDVYEDCPQLTRLAGQCPCDLLRTGDCMESTVLPGLPDSFVGPMNTSYDVDAQWLTRKRYREIDEFEFIKPGYTTNIDFGSAIRPWDDHDFSIVEERREEFSKRGKQRSLDVAHFKEHCPKCVFSYEHPVSKQLQSCDELRACVGAVSDAEAEEYLDDRYRQLEFEDMKGFTAAERNYLISMGHASIRSDLITGNRKIHAHLGGFVLLPGSGWVMMVTPRGGRMDRVAYAKHYEDLYESTTGAVLAKPSEIPKVDIPYRVRRGLALCGERAYRHVWGRGQLEMNRVIWSHHGGDGIVSWSAVNSTSEHYFMTLGINKGPDHWVDALSYSKSTISQVTRSSRERKVRADS